MTPPDYETTCRIDLPDEKACSVRVVFTVVRYSPDDTPERYPDRDINIVVGVFRIDDDSEVDYQSLAQSQQHKIDEACEQALAK